MDHALKEALDASSTRMYGVMDILLGGMHGMLHGWWRSSMEFVLVYPMPSYGREGYVG